MIGLARERAAAARAAWWNRGLSAALVASYLAAAWLLVPDPSRRSELHYAVVISLGYGHLSGAAVFSGDRLARGLKARLPRGWQRVQGMRRSHVVCGMLWPVSLLLFAAYHLASSHAPWLVLLLLGISTWHTAENDQALASIYGRSLSAGPLSRRAGPHLSALGFTALLLGLAATTLGEADPTILTLVPDRAEGVVSASQLVMPARLLAALCGGLLLLRPRRHGDTLRATSIIVGSALLPSDPLLLHGLSFGDVFAASSLYHLASWLWLSIDRARVRQEPRACTTLVVLHALPAALCVGLLLHGDSQIFGPLAAAYFSPAVYLYWSTLHVLQTLAVRELTSTPDHQSGVVSNGLGSGSSNGSKGHQRQDTFPGGLA
jgi:hypothetical protein